MSSADNLSRLFEIRQVLKKTPKNNADSESRKILVRDLHSLLICFLESISAVGSLLVDSTIEQQPETVNAIGFLVQSLSELIIETLNDIEKFQ